MTTPKRSFDDFDFEGVELDDFEDMGYKGFEYFSNDDNEPKELDFEY